MRKVSQPFIRSQDGLVPSRPSEPVTQGSSSGRAALPSSALATPACSFSATAITSSVARSAPAPTSMATLLAGVEHGGRPMQQVIARQLRRPCVADAGMSGAVGHRRLLVGQLLQVIGNDDAGDGSPRRRDAHRPVDEVAQLTRHAGGRDEIRRDILEQRLQIDFLLIVCADAGTRLLAHYGDDGYVVHLRVVQAGEQVDRAGSGSGVAESDLAGELGVAPKP